MLRSWCPFACFAGALVGCSTTQVSNTPIEIPVACQTFISPRDVEEIRAILLSRTDIRKPFWGITCGHDCAIAESGPHRSGDISNFVTLCHRHGKWHIIKIEEGPVVVVTQWLPSRPNQALERAADRRANLLLVTSALKSAAQLAVVSGRSACSR
jgi:hypothetical protein